MSPFSYLLIGHLIGDYLLQTKWMAVHKANRWDALILHSTVYTFCIFLLSLWGEVNVGIPGLFFVWGTHVVLDRRSFVAWWSRTILANEEPTERWLVIMVDQIFHLLVLAVVLHYHW